MFHCIHTEAMITIVKNQKKIKQLAEPEGLRNQKQTWNERKLLMVFALLKQFLAQIIFVRC
jgi:hypothetical protein